MSSDVETIKERLDIADVVGEYVTLKQAGRNLRGLSPFTNEKTPSFFVSPDRQLFHCFSSGRGGDMFTFIQEVEGVDFRGALTMLAERAGVELTRQSAESRKKEDVLYDIMEEAAAFFETCLEDAEDAQVYLNKRGFTVDTITSWRLGYAPNEWRALLTHLRKHGYADADMLRAGVIKERDASRGGSGGERYYDTFRGRIMFPLFDTSGRVIAFSGRILVGEADTQAPGSGEAPKYVNSPETPLYNKSTVLYGLDRAKAAIRRQDYAVLVEGQTDVVLSHQFGLRNTVASSGTALTERQLETLKRFSDRLIVAYDSDRAGFTASAKNAELGMQMGMDVKVAPLPEGKDPADVLLTDPQELQEILTRGTHIVDFYTERITADESDTRSVARRVRDEVLPLVAYVQSAIETSHFVRKIADITGISEQAVWDDLKALPQKGGRKPLNSNGTSEKREQPARGRQEAILRELYGILAWQKTRSDTPVDLSVVESRIEEIIGEEEFKKCTEELTGEEGSLVFEAEVKHGESEMIDAVIDDLMMHLEHEAIRAQFTDVMQRLARAEKEGNAEESAELFAKCQELSGRMAHMSSPQT